MVIGCQVRLLSNLSKMGQDLVSLFQLVTKRLLWLIVIMFAVILAFQYFELPYFTTSATSRFQLADPPSESELFNNITTLNQANYTDESFNGDSIRISDNRSETEQVKNIGLSSYNNTMGMNSTKEFNSPSPSHAIAPSNLTPLISPPTIENLDIIPPVLSNDSDRTDSVKDEIFWPVRDDVNLQSKDSSINIVPKENKDSHRPVREVTPISEMEKLLLQNHARYPSMRPRWSSAVDQELLHARSEIEHAPIVENDENLYAPLFRNVSMFKRSYELMEETLKVYIYKEGAKPIMHSPYLLGIYASEGWFMRMMKSNKRFVTKDPKKAHLFYLPFSSRMLEETLYIQNSHSHKNLIKYLNDYVDMIAAKHRFWNRTGGADHFLAACHDWAPTETKHHMAKCIRALCNSDVKEGFILGKDVSLPETYVRNARNPTRDLGGNKLSMRKTLAFFAGGMHGYLRPILLQHWENKDPDMKIFGMMPKSKGDRNYIKYMKSSKYCICPKGFEVNSPRVVEAILYECVPVIISDNFVPPFFEVLNWESFAVFVLEKDIPNLKSILLSIPHRRYLQLQMGVKKVQQHFLWHRSPVKYDIFHMILHSVWYNRVFTARAR